jgi:hypothetical protein
MRPINYLKISVCIFALNLANTSFASDAWYLITESDSNISIAINLATLERQNNLVIFWERVEFDEPEQQDEISGRLIKYKRTQRVFNCETRTQGVLRGALFDENNKLIEASIAELADVAMTSIPPDTFAESQYDLVCSLP